MESPMPDLKTTTEPQVTTTTPTKKKAPGLSFRRFFTKPGVSPYDEVEWDLRLAQITDAQGNVIFEQKEVEVPKDWSMTATNIVASKYLHGKLGTPERESGVRQLVGRVVETSPRSLPPPAQNRRHALQVGPGHGTDPLAPPLVARTSLRRRHSQRPAQLYERIRRLRRRNKARRQNPPRRQDGHPQRRSS